MIYVHVSGFISFEFYVLSPQLSGILIYQLQERQRLEEETDVGPLLHGNQETSLLESQRPKENESRQGRGGEDSMLRRVHPKKRSVSWVNSVPRQFLPNGSFFFEKLWSGRG